MPVVFSTSAGGRKIYGQKFPVPKILVCFVKLLVHSSISMSICCVLIFNYLRLSSFLLFTLIKPSSLFIVDFRPLTDITATGKATYPYVMEHDLRQISRYWVHSISNHLLVLICAQRPQKRYVNVSCAKVFHHGRSYKDNFLHNIILCLF